MSLLFDNLFSAFQFYKKFFSYSKLIDYADFFDK